MGRIVSRKEIYEDGIPDQLILEYFGDGEVTEWNLGVKIHCFSSGWIKSISVATDRGCPFEVLQEAIAIAKDWAEQAEKLLFEKIDAEEGHND